ncbi:vasculin isoform 4-T9 [Amazona ochrocephala]
MTLLQPGLISLLHHHQQRCLRSTACAPLQSSLNFEKHSENFSCTENRYEANRRRHNSSDGFDPNIARASGGYFGRKEKTGWRSQGRNFTENLNHHGGYYGGSSRACTSAFHCGKGQGLHENNVPDNKTGKKEDRGVPKHFEAEDFPSLNPEYEREPNQNKSFAAGVWDYPLNPKSRCQRMLVIKKGSAKEVQIPGFPVVGNLHSQPVKNGTATSVYKGLVPKPVTPTLKCNRSNSSSPVDKVAQPRLTKLTRMQTDKKSEFLKTLKQDRVEEEHENANDAVQNKNDESFNVHNSNSPPHERDVNRNFENEIPQESGSSSVTSQQIIRSSAFPQADVLSSSLEAEHRLLKEMGWQEDSENDEAYAPLTEDEMREFRVISEQLRKNGLRTNGILKNGLIRDFKFSPWKTSTFKPALEIEDSETSSSDTSDDDDL